MGLKFERKLKCEASSPFDSLIAVGKDDDEKLCDFPFDICNKRRFLPNQNTSTVTPILFFQQYKLVKKKKKRKINITIHNNFTCTLLHPTTTSQLAIPVKLTKEKIYTGGSQRNSWSS